MIGSELRHRETSRLLKLRTILRGNRGAALVLRHALTLSYGFANPLTIRELGGNAVAFEPRRNPGLHKVTFEKST